MKIRTEQNDSSLKANETDINLGPHGSYFYYLLVLNPALWITLLIALVPVADYLIDLPIWHYLMETPAGWIGVSPWLLWGGITLLFGVFAYLPAMVIFKTTNYTYHKRINPNKGRPGENEFTMWLDVETFTFTGKTIGKSNDSIAYSMVSDCDIHQGIFEMMFAMGKAGTIEVTVSGNGRSAALKKIPFVRYPTYVRDNIMANAGLVGTRMIAGA